MHFDSDAFISYAHLDNMELIEGKKGWVANLHRALEIRVAQLLGKSPRIWRDPKLQGNDLFAETLVERVGRVAILVTVVSPRWVKSEWTNRELSEFWAAAEHQGGIRVGDKARVFKVLKTPVPLDKTPATLQGLLGYEFFKTDPDTGKIRELDEVFGPEAQRDFWLKLDDLAHDVCDLLERLEAAAADALRPADSAESVYLAETTADLRERRESIKRELLQRGLLVFPARPLPFERSEAAAAIREDLARCRMSIHLIGRGYGLVPEGSTESIIELQHELAVERGRQGGLSRLVWIPAGLSVEDPRQRAVVERLRMDPRADKNADLLETSFEDLLTEIQQGLTRRPDAPATAPTAPTSATAAPQLYLVHDPRDTDRVEPWANALFERRLEVIRPVFEGDEAEIREFHEETLASCDGVLIFYGAANELWLRRKLKEIQKSAGFGRTKPAAAVAIALIGTKTPEKERFRTHEALVAPAWDAVSVDLLKPFVSRLIGDV